MYKVKIDNLLHEQRDFYSVVYEFQMYVLITNCCKYDSHAFLEINAKLRFLTTIDMGCEIKEMQVIYHVSESQVVGSDSLFLKELFVTVFKLKKCR